MSGLLERIAEKKSAELKKIMKEMLEVLEDIDEKLSLLLRCLDCQEKGKGKRSRQKKT